MDIILLFLIEYGDNNTFYMIDMNNITNKIKVKPKESDKIRIKCLKSWGFHAFTNKKLDELVYPREFQMETMRRHLREGFKIEILPPLLYELINRYENLYGYLRKKE